MNEVQEHGFGEVILATEYRCDFLESDLFVAAHKNLVIPCHDVYISINGGILLLIRDNEPCKGKLAPVGGRLLRGRSIEESLKMKVRDECGLEINELKLIGITRTLFPTAPFEHKKGTDTLNLTYLARGTGAITLDQHHSGYQILHPEEYTEEFRKTLPEYTHELLEKALASIS